MSFDRFAFLAQVQQQESGGPADMIGTVITLVIVVLMIAGIWKTFAKAGLPGWGAIVPIYNAYLMCKVAGRPGWWLLLFLVPLVNFVVAIVVAIDIARNFGKGSLFGLGLAFLGFIFYPILGFGDAQYLGDGTGKGSPLRYRDPVGV